MYDRMINFGDLRHVISPIVAEQQPLVSKKGTYSVLGDLVIEPTKNGSLNTNVP